MKNALTKQSKYFVLISIIVAAVILTGCSQLGTVEKYKVGTNGLVIEFTKSNPTSVYEHEEFGTSLLIKNMGSYDISPNNPARLKVLYDNYRLSSKDNTGNIDVPNIVLNGKSQYYPTGSESSVEFYFQSSLLTQLRESAKTTINYNLCYPYVTEFTTMTCIDTKAATNADLAAACTSTAYNGGAGQGAPIVITKIEPQILLQENYIRPQYRIYIENVGGGYVSKKNTCDINDMNNVNIFSDKTDEFSGRVTVYATLSGEKLDCGPDKTGVLSLIDSNSYITCYLSKTANQNKYSRTNKNYLSPLTVRVEYTYVSLEKQDIEIKRNDLVAPPVTQGLCLSYQIEYNGKCMDKCEYCSQVNPQAPMCQEGKPYAGFTFKTNFSCKCSLQQCDIKEPKGSCIKGYCNGDSYCCSTLNCDPWEVEYNGECIDKCQYCSQINSSDTQICSSSFNFLGFECRPMQKEDCEALASTNNACIVGYCGANLAHGGKPGDENLRYCANIKRSSCPPAGNPGLTEVDPSGNCIDLCQYCALYGQNDPRCKFSSNAQQRTIPHNFRCNCNQQTIINNTNFIPDDSFCGRGSGIFCCG